MITELHIENFKSLKNVKLNPRALTVLVGLNGSGKSSVLQVLHSVKMRGRNNSEFSINFNQLSSLGKSNDIFYKFGEDAPLQIRIGFPITTIYDNHGVYQEDLGLCYLNFISEYTPKISDMIFKLNKENTSKGKLSNQIDIFFKNPYQYLSAIRLAPVKTYYEHHTNSKNEDLGFQGEQTVSFLSSYGKNRKITQESLLHSNAKSDKLLHQVNAWMDCVSPGVQLAVREVPDSTNLVLEYNFSLGDGEFTEPFSPPNVGTGITYTLPVVVAFLITTPDKLTLIENPEAHLHPRGQAELGKLAARAATAGGQFFIETHSDHFINGLRVAVKEGLISKDEVVIYFFERVTKDGEQYSEVTPIYIDARGELSEYPKHFMDEDIIQLSKLI